jgi:hypothetical protein
MVQLIPLLDWYRPKYDVAISMGETCLNGMFLEAFWWAGNGCPSAFALLGRSDLLAFLSSWSGRC